jgi:hypothetical protein
VWRFAKEVRKLALEQWPLITVGLIGGAVLGAQIRGIAHLARASRNAWPPAVGLGALARVVGAIAWISGRAMLRRARVSDVTLKLGFSDVKVPFDPDGLQQLWRFFIEITSSVASRALPPGEGSLEEALKSMYSLFERAHADLSARPPRGTAPSGMVPAHAYVLSILNEDLRPCLTRWHVRLDAWKRTGLPEAAWPLRDICRGDLEITRQRTVERAWQLGAGLGIPNLDQLLPPRLSRPEDIPAMATSEALAHAEITAGAARDDALKAGWHIYVETATRIATQELPPGAGLLGEAIGSLYVLFGEIRGGLKLIPPARSLGAPVSIEALAFRLLNEGLRPFLAEWHPRYEAFRALGRPEGWYTSLRPELLQRRGYR